MYNFNQARSKFDSANVLLWSSRFMDGEIWSKTRAAIVRKTEKDCNILEVLEKVFPKDKTFIIPCEEPLKMSGAEIQATVILWLEKQTRKVVVEILNGNHRILAWILASAIKGIKLSPIVSIVDTTGDSVEKISLIENTNDTKHITLITADRLDLLSTVYKNEPHGRGFGTKLKADGMVKNDHERIWYSNAVELTLDGYGVTPNDLLLPTPFPRVDIAKIKKAPNAKQYITDYRKAVVDGNKEKATTLAEFKKEKTRFENGHITDEPLYKQICICMNAVKLRKAVTAAIAGRNPAVTEVVTPEVVTPEVVTK